MVCHSETSTGDGSLSTSLRTHRAVPEGLQARPVMPSEQEFSCHHAKASSENGNRINIGIEGYNYVCIYIYILCNYVTMYIKNNTIDYI